MRPLRALVRAAILASFMVWLTAAPALAQLTPTPKPKGGLCAPWHKCMAQGILGIVVLYLLFLGAMFAFQRRGFGGVEHRQGNPEGVKRGE